MSSDSLTGFDRFGSPQATPATADPFADYASQLVHIYKYEHHPSKTINRIDCPPPPFGLMKDFDQLLPPQLYPSAFDYTSPLFNPSPPPVIPRFVHVPPPFSLNMPPSLQEQRPIKRPAPTKPLSSMQRDAKKIRSRLPASSVTVMQDWFMEHLNWPYPNDEDKKVIAERANLTVAQVVNWFTNTRKRFWIPNKDKFVDEHGNIRSDIRSFEDVHLAASLNSPAYISSTSDSGDL